MCCKDKPVIKFKKTHPDAIIPTIATDGSAGFDLTAISDPIYDEEYGVYSYDTGIAMEIPKGYVGLLVPRSSVYKTGLSLCNSCGIIDSDFRGSVSFKFYQMLVRDEGCWPKKGDRMGQLVVVPCLTLSEEVTELSDTARGQGGFGSSGT
jgi:dUTP pyrophosphatase